jgi:hypothetical protein
VIAILVATTIASTDKNEKPPEMADDANSGGFKHSMLNAVTSVADAL